MRNAKCFVQMLLLSILFFSCSKDQDYTIDTSSLSGSLNLSQPQILSVDDSGISLRFYIENNNDAIKEYGVVWYLTENKELRQNCVEAFQGRPQKKEVSLKIKNGLPKSQLIYIRAYAKINGEVHYGQFVSVYSKGGNSPVIKSVLPENPKLTQQIKIEGEGFVNTQNSEYLRVLVNKFEIKPDSVTEKSIYFTLPSEYIESYNFNYNMTIGLKVFGKEYNYEKEYKFASPWKKIDLPTDFSSFAFKRGTATVLNNKAYVLIGKQYNKMFVYDILNNQWTTIDYPGKPEQSFGGPHINCYNFTANNKIYSIIDDVLYSKSESSSWQEVTKYPGNKEITIGPFQYFYKGDLYKGNFDVNYYPIHIPGRGRIFYKYNINSGVWTELTPIPNNGGGIYNYFVFVYDNNLNFGTIRGNEAYDFSKNLRIWSYSIDGDNWSWNFNNGDNADYPTTDNLNTVVSFTINDQIFMGLGENHDDWPEYCSNKLWKFNPKTRYWDMISRCPDKVNVSATFIYNNKAYILGTEQDEAFSDKELKRKKFFYEFDPSLI